jgi:hypothetical protein
MSARRTFLPPAAVAVVLAAGLFPGQAARAATPDGWPETAWDVCADDAGRYCVESATLTPVGGAPTPLAELGLSASAGPTESGLLAWAVDGWAEQPEDVQGGELSLVLRTGAYVPRFTTAVADGLTVSRSVDDAADWTMTVTGRAVHVDWTTGGNAGMCDARQYCGESDQMADEAGTGYRFSGVTQDLDGIGGPEFVDSIDGAYLASDGQARTEMITWSTEPDPYLWLGVLGNPHLDVEGRPVRGSFNAWVPAAYFEQFGTTAADAVENGFDLVDQSRGVPVSLPVSAAERAGGVGFTATDIGYGMTTWRSTTGRRAPRRA